MGKASFSDMNELIAKYGYTALRFYLLSLARELLPNDRIRICWRYPLPDRETVDLIYSEERKRARALGTMKCGSAWLCPVCSTYIAERRRQELGQALEAMRDRYFCVMVTYTIQHNANMRLKPLLTEMQKAFRYVKTGRDWQEIKSEFALVGSIRAIEITYGAAGWHPHYHEMMIVELDHLREFYEGSISEYAEGLEAIMVKRWLDGLQARELSASEERGLKVSSTTDDVKDYIAKYGKMPLERDFASDAYEVTYGSTKTARNGNLSVWEILYHASSSKKHQRLFLEYVEATRKRSQLQWSRGLKALLNIDSVREEMAAEGIETPTDRVLAKIPVDLWRSLAETDCLGQVMTFAHAGDAQRLARYLESKAAQYSINRVDFSEFDIHDWM